MKIDYKNICKNYNKEVGCYGTFDGNCIKENCFTYKLLQQLQAKEEECEELKKIINEAKNSKLDLKSFLVGEAVQNEYEQQLDQLKKENEELKEQLTILDDEDVVVEITVKQFEEYKKLKQTLTEIKEIAEPYQKEIKKICGNCDNYDDCHACCKFDLNCYQYKKGDMTTCEKFIMPWKYYINELANAILQKISECYE